MNGQPLLGSVLLGDCFVPVCVLRHYYYGHLLVQQNEKDCLQFYCNLFSKYSDPLSGLFKQIYWC